MSAQVVQAGELGVHAAQWDALVAASPLPSPFLRSWWLGSLDLARKPRFALVLDGERLIGGLALQRRRLLGVDVLTALGGGRLCPDHLDLVADQGREDDVVAALGSWFRKSSRVLELDGLREDALVLRAFGPGAATATDVAWWEPLPSEPAAYHAARSTKFASKGRKARRRLERAGVEFRRTPPEDVPSALDAFEALHSVRADRLPLLSHGEEIRRFVLAGVAAGEVRLHEAIRGRDRVAVLIGFVTGDRWMTYQLARSLDNEMRDVGTVLRLSAVDDACLSGLTELDLLRGDEPYKRSFTTRSRALLRLRAAHGLRGRALLGAVRCGEAAQRALATTRQQWRSRTRRSRP